ncbi:hypothetical protein EST38_g10263 [Candolleomyces aberdarensis]|uniref:Uncharacterized protein n=1 Tax=Candolleomyces aberdarensis TaxID=2316362 RepID=A0A4Q2DA09_9AGAR|nr:hypothetical protein EST38_g10263 [Candolleomyces aberdarensis]
MNAPLTWLTSTPAMVYEIRRRPEPSTALEDDPIKKFTLHGVKSSGNYIAQEDKTTALPADITDTLEQWVKIEEENPAVGTGGERSVQVYRLSFICLPDKYSWGTSTALSKKEILQFVYTTILNKYAIEKGQSDALDTSTATVHSPPSKEKRISQGADLLLFIQAGNSGEQLNVATKLVAATKPSEWPAKAIANQILVLREILFDGADKPDYDPEAGRMFFDEREVEIFLLLIQSACRKTVGTELETFLRRFCVGRHVANSSLLKAVEDREFQTASELLAFVRPDDKTSRTLILEALGAYSMPMEGIEQAIFQILTKSCSLFFDNVRSEVSRRINARKIPLPSLSRGRRWQLPTQSHNSPDPKYASSYHEPARVLTTTPTQLELRICLQSRPRIRIYSECTGSSRAAAKEQHHSRSLYDQHLHSSEEKRLINLSS